MIEGKAKVLKTCSVCIMKTDPANDCTVTHHKPTTETEQVSEMMVLINFDAADSLRSFLVPSASVFYHQSLKFYKT
jgi:ABC-type enterochelin transport system substrate-binding protein